jgi:hypothetical protein
MAIGPLLAAASPPAEKAWEEIRPLRRRLGDLLESINTDEVRHVLAERLSEWLGRFR